MITSERIKGLTYISLDALQQILVENGYPEMSKTQIESVKFLGITNGGEFCYRVVHQPVGNERREDKVFYRNDRLLEIVKKNLGENYA